LIVTLMTVDVQEECLRTLSNMWKQLVDLNPTMIILILLEEDTPQVANSIKQISLQLLVVSRQFLEKQDCTNKLRLLLEDLFQFVLMLQDGNPIPEEFSLAVATKWIIACNLLDIETMEKVELFGSFVTRGEKVGEMEDIFGLQLALIYAELETMLLFVTHLEVYIFDIL